MSIEIINKLEKDKKLHDYLYHHSWWYKMLNRSEDYYEDFVKEFKEFKRNNNFNKVNDIVDNVDLISNVLKFMN